MKQRLPLLALLLLGAVLAAPAPALALSPKWEVTSVPEPSVFSLGSIGEGSAYNIVVTNIGDGPQTAPLTITDALPDGVAAHAFLLSKNVHRESGVNIVAQAESLGTEHCSLTPVVRCEWPANPSLPESEQPLLPGDTLSMEVIVTPGSGPEGVLTNTVTASGGGGADAVDTFTNQLGETPAPFGVSRFEMQARQADGSPFTQAGGHPYELSTTIYLNTIGPFENNSVLPSATVRNLSADLPSGLVGDPVAVENSRCSLADFQADTCPPSTQVGTGFILLNFQTNGFFTPNYGVIYNLVPSYGQVAQFGFHLGIGFTATITPGVRSGSDYGIRTTSFDTAQALNPIAFHVTLWGDPATATPPTHASEGAECFENVTPGTWSGECPIPIAPYPFLTMPTSCSGQALTAGVLADSWASPGSFVPEQSTPFSQPLTGCNQLPFAPSITAKPTTNHADSPSGLEVDLHLPQHFGEAESLATADLKDATVTLPAGITLNPSSANGRSACTEAQVGYKPGTSSPFEFTNAPAECPDAAKVGTVEIETPLLDHPIGNGSSADPAGDLGAVYLAKPGKNPFGSLLALYLVVEDPQTGLLVKLAGKVTPDPQTGQLTTTFEENPQQPFEHFRLNFFGGAIGALRTPPTCGSYESTANFTPWSAPEGQDVHWQDSFQITGSASGEGACPTSASEEPNAPVFHAGTENVQAGQFSPFAFKLKREDGSQEFAKIETTLPPGLVGRLAGVGECSEAQIAQAQSREHEGGGEEEKANPSCPASSEVGTVEVGAGAGPTPYYTQGKAYLAGPYKNAPLSLAIITPAVAGPFDLGAVLVRTALYVDPETAQIKAVSDPIPHILQGIPLDVRSITLKMSRPNFTLNPTNCNELGFTGSETSLLGNAAPLSQRFQVSGCSALPFHPKLSISLKGSTKRAGHPALKAVLKMKGGEANIAKAQVTLPHSEFLDQAHIGTVCTRVQFAEGNVPGERCPPASIYGFARASTPLLDHPLEGPVYLRSSSHKLPDLIAALNGQIQVALDGRIDTGRTGGIRNTFEVVPDAPVSRFELSMQGGRKGLLVNSTNICQGKPQHALADFTAQNGKVSDTEPVVRAKCARAHGRKGHGGHR